MIWSSRFWSSSSSSSEKSLLRFSSISCRISRSILAISTFAPVENMKKGYRMQDAGCKMQDASLRPGLGLAGRASMQDTITAMEILIVDDEKNIRSSLSRFFELHGNEVMTAENGREAVESIRKRSF